ncbi:hypothetical protein GH5_07309 [Leishmania sp. Ghana 2012 LV757]|uniref:hypothetical protein n=1 Tax=Leishmania sp. Ghana 2012 LV757 TaxID=2803181 RepID=UPI001B3CAB5F|nr:hypothetical protein GH5_07309 [Leishmania sp. Ghana 2012 LV757]
MLAKSKSVLVGDSRQLQPTVLSWEASRCGLRRSLLVRLLACGHPTFLLRRQYRMHPDIVAFPNGYFYDSKLLTDRSVLARSRAPDDPTASTATVAQKLSHCPRFVFVDVRDSTMERRRGRSLLNRREAAAVVDYMRQLRAFLQLTAQETAAGVGIITFYTAQRDAILSMLTHEERRSGVQVATVDSFQGKEKCIILLSCVRTLSTAQLLQLERRAEQREKSLNSDDGDGVTMEERSANRRLGRYGLGFLADWHRLNVALTRARDLCVCFASRDTVRAVGMAAMASAAPSHAVTTVDTSVEDVQREKTTRTEDLQMAAVVLSCRQSLAVDWGHRVLCPRRGVVTPLRLRLSPCAPFSFEAADACEAVVPRGTPVDRRGLHDPFAVSAEVHTDR